LRALAAGFSAAASRLLSWGAAATAHNLLLARTKISEATTLDVLDRAWAGILADLPPAARRHRTLALGSGLGCISGGSAPLGFLPVLLPAAEMPRCRLSTEQLIDLLKKPTCVGKPRRVILDHLGQRYQRRFEDVWEFVEFLREQQLPLDFASPWR
jgi:hypothetical protein